ncbi:hypothetical protein HMPREF7545_1728 [Selenomonas noxia ATCC 43541]|nr:hypothetical protein HMPREF7545_1728 [Selenomonas noxia ATCC 43541]
MNHFVGIGRLTRDPNVKYTQSGKAYASFTLAIDRFAFRYALPRQSYALSLVSDLVLRRVDEFEDWQLRDMIGEIEAHWEENNEIHPIDRDVQRLFRDRLRGALLERGVAQAV